MKQSETIFLFLILALLAGFFVATMVVGTNQYKKREEERFSLLSHFPFELVGEGPNASPWMRLLVVGYAIVESVAYAFPLVGGERFLFAQPMAITVLLVAFLKNLLALGVFFIPAHRFKPHLFAFILYASVSALMGVLCGSFFLGLNPLKEVIATAFAVVSFLLAVIVMIALLNPHLSRWTEMNLEVAEDGTMNPVRPRPFVLAFTQWLLVILGLAYCLIYLLGISVIILA